MKQEALFKKLGNILNELNEQYQFLSQNPDQLSELELELFLANANFLADHIQIIKKLNLPLQAPPTSKPMEEPTVDEEMGDDLRDVQQLEAITFANTVVEEGEDEKHFELTEPLAAKEETHVALSEEQDALAHEQPIVSEHEQEIFRLEEEPAPAFEFILNADRYTEEDKFDFEEKTADQLFDRPLSDEEALILEQKRKVKENLIRNQEELEEDEIGPEPFLVHHEEIAEQQVAEPTVSTPTVDLPPVIAQKVVAETPKQEATEVYKPTLNDILAGNTTAARVNDTSGTAVTDLKAAINLNDKLLYIKDLFNGYNLAYAEAIDIANKMPNFDAADNFLQKNYAVKNNWANKQSTVDKFYLLLNRRFKD